MAYADYPIMVFRNGRIQAETSDYTTATVNGVTRITFIPALQADDHIMVIYAYEA